ncbi:MAG: 2-C-methyl-D-erythritol 4-phosphate cytidylyltransferase [Cycloclasticus sp. symbiont of Poecilosclerida sp. M]|nr:MAG: 2-C-methyl-D-erythritol 4-phosphate cytidylyltransferase [Cycloclasticus sp. symbiont of Poecilosclerida sp. M]
MVASIENVWCIVPAGGIGKRMNSAIPKQYLAFQSTTVIDFTLKRLLRCKQIDKVIVAIHEDDIEWKNTAYVEHPKVITTHGGVERAHSVLNALQKIKTLGKAQDWVLVHDAARPCVLPSDIELLIGLADKKKTGAILAAPIADTVKQVSNGRVDKTLDRQCLWRALTPQIFRVKELEDALLGAMEMNAPVTDEASAIELAGGKPLIAEGRGDNIKITSPMDLSMASYIIEQQELSKCE